MCKILPGDDVVTHGGSALVPTGALAPRVPERLAVRREGVFAIVVPVFAEPQQLPMGSQQPAGPQPPMGVEEAVTRGVPSDRVILRSPGRGRGVPQEDAHASLLASEAGSPHLLDEPWVILLPELETPEPMDEVEESGGARQGAAAGQGAGHGQSVSDDAADEDDVASDASE